MALTSAQQMSSSFTTLRCPASAAKCSAVEPSLSVALTSAQQMSSSFTTSCAPCFAAKKSAWRLGRSDGEILAPRRDHKTFQKNSNIAIGNGSLCTNQVKNHFVFSHTYTLPQNKNTHSNTRGLCESIATRGWVSHCPVYACILFWHILLLTVVTALVNYVFGGTSIVLFFLSLVVFCFLDFFYSHRRLE